MLKRLSKRIATFSLLIIHVSTGQSFGQEFIVQKFVPRSHTLQSSTLPYRLFIPESYDSTQSYPLVLTLHGSGERGSDNIPHIRPYRNATAWADPANQSQHPCFVVAPQCPLNASWDDFIPLLKDLVDSLEREFSIDAKRLYITGLSMGGYGTFQMIATYPNEFAAAIPMSSGWDTTQVESFAHIPIWNFHGALDDAVPVSESHDVIRALERAGKDPVYTHCRYRDCRILQDSILDMYINSHANLLYTEYQNGGHIIWDESYNHPRLMEWTFSKVRQTPDAITLTSFTSNETISGTVSITWSAIELAGDSVEIWFSPDAGKNWQLVERSTENDGSYEWNTGLIEDCAFGLLKIFLKDTHGFIIGESWSKFITINNGAGNGSPFIKILNNDFVTSKVFDQDTLKLSVLAGDPEGTDLTFSIDYSSNGGSTYQEYDERSLSSDTNVQIVPMLLPLLPNSNQAVLRLTVNDGNSTSGDFTFPFYKQSSRLTGSAPIHVGGTSAGKVVVQIANPAALNGHLYRVTFALNDEEKISYDVTDVDFGLTVVSGATELDGTTEGPYFDGLRLLVTDYRRPVIDAANTRWLNTSPTIVPVNVFLPEIDMGSGTFVYGFPFGADYNLIFSNEVLDTSSSAIFGLPEIPTQFSIQNITDGRRTKFIFVDNDFNQTLSNHDEVYLLEPDSLSQLSLSWGLSFAGTGIVTLPQPGDTFALRTLKPIREDDVFEFRAVVVGVDDKEIPKEFVLEQNYPNPFNPVTEIRYQISEVGNVSLKVYDILGREVTTLIDERQQPGTYSVRWDAGVKASGVYFYRLRAGSFSSTKKMFLVR